jgi:hypothetical protein
LVRRFMGRESCLRICSMRLRSLSFFSAFSCLLLSFLFFSSSVLSRISMTAISLGRPSAFLLRMIFSVQRSGNFYKQWWGIHAIHSHFPEYNLSLWVQLRCCQYFL